MYNLKFGCQSYPWKMGKHFGQLPRMLKVAAEAGFQSIECEIDMLGTWFHDPEGVKKQLEKYNMEFAALVLHQPCLERAEEQDADHVAHRVEDRQQHHDAPIEDALPIQPDEQQVRQRPEDDDRDGAFI